MGSLPHTACYRGKLVRIGLKDGTVIFDRFHDRTKTHVFLKSGRKIHKADIKSFGIVQGGDNMMARILNKKIRV